MYILKSLINIDLQVVVLSEYVNSIFVTVRDLQLLLYVEQPANCQTVDQLVQY